MSHFNPLDKTNPIIIVGAGVFGLSTALELKNRGFIDVTVLDRDMPPVMDGSSVDISRIIRIDYADPIYAKMAQEAYHGWVTKYQAHFNGTGFIMMAEKRGNPYLEKAVEIGRSQGFQYQECNSLSEITQRFVSVSSDMENLKAYINDTGGWADAQGSIRQLSQNCTAAGVKYITGVAGTVKNLLFSDNRIIGVQTLDDKSLLANRVILATGAWTNRLLALEHATTASGQPVGFIQLTQEEADSLRGSPVMINLSSGVFVFPPTPDTNILKVARHCYGFATQIEVDKGDRVISSPKLRSPSSENSFIPSEADKALRDGLRQLIPRFADHPWSKCRLCWYSDTPEGDFIIDHHQELPGLFIATGGSGHAFKFLPVLGRYIVDCFEKIAPEPMRLKWRLKNMEEGVLTPKNGDGSRSGPPLRVLSQQEQDRL